MKKKQLLLICDIPPYTDYVNYVINEYDIVCSSLKALLSVPKDDVKHITVVGSSKPAITAISLVCVEKGYDVIIDLDGCPKMKHSEKKEWMEHLLNNGVMVFE
jgi:hypothetical protein